MERSRRRRVPAFGEWNYYYYSGELVTPPAVPTGSEWSAAAAAGPELEASSDVWFKYSPPPRKPPAGGRKARRPQKTDGSCGGKRGLHRAATHARASDAVAPPAVARTLVSNKAGAGAGARARVVRPVDADLYQVPPPEFGPDDEDEPPRRWHKKKKNNKPSSRRSMWMGCFGFNCIPTE